MSDEILINYNAGVCEIVLNRPDRLNAFTDTMHVAFRQALHDARDNSECRALLISGAGRGFCTGQDLSARDPRGRSEPPDLGKTLNQNLNPLIRLLRSLSKPVVCAVNGVAAGAGANIALACDIVVASDQAKFIQSFAKVGLIPDAGGTWLLPALIGEARAKALALTATPVSAQQAQEWGMIWKCIAHDHLMDNARELATGLAQGPTFGLGNIKMAVQSASTHSLDEHLDFEARLQQSCGHSSDYAEGVLAFLEKRKPSFDGLPPQADADSSLTTDKDTKV